MVVLRHVVNRIWPQPVLGAELHTMERPSAVSTIIASTLKPQLPHKAGAEVQVKIGTCRSGCGCGCIGYG